MRKLRSQDIRPGQMMIDINIDLPSIFHYMSQTREEVKKFYGWPDWCDTPDAVAVTTLIKHFKDIKLSSLAKGNEPGSAWPISERLAFNYLHPTLTALYTWNRSKNVYRFDDAFSKELADMEFEGKLPVEVLYRIPEWCVYVDFGEHPINDTVGFFAFLEYDITLKTNELYIMAVLKQGYLCIPFRVFIGDFDLRESQVRVVMQDFSCSREEAEVLLDKDEALLYKYLVPLLNHLIYLCSKEPDVSGRGSRAVRKAQGREINNTPIVTEWDVGVRIGRELRAYKEIGEGARRGEGEGSGEGTIRRRPRPHVRRAHWHHFWRGSRKSKEERELIVKWLHPMYVNTENAEQLPVVIRTIK